MVDFSTGLSFSFFLACSFVIVRPLSWFIDLFSICSLFLTSCRRGVLEM